MSYPLELKGFNSIEVKDDFYTLPDFHVVLRSPMGTRISADDLYKYGGEINRALLDRTPLRNTKKYVNVYTGIVAYPGSEHIAVPTTDWHCDGSNVPFLEDDIFHTAIVLGPHVEGDLLTEFLPEDRVIDIPDDVAIDKMNHEQFRRYMTMNTEKFQLESKSVEAGKLYTWTSKHLHRVQYPTKAHFRFFWKVAESDTLVPNPKEKAFRNYTEMFEGNYGKMGYSVEQGERGIFLRSLHV